MKEIWKDIKGYEGIYQISNLGKVKSLKRYKKNKSKLQLVNEKILSNYTNSKNGYVYVYLCKDGNYKNVRLHKLVAQTFIENPMNYKYINHINGDKTNNNVNNLEWCTQSYNVIDSRKRNGSYDNDNKIIRLYKIYKNCKKVANIVGFSSENIRQILKRNNVHIYSKHEQSLLRNGWLDD